jgi:hypothetical protein
MLERCCQTLAARIVILPVDHSAILFRALAPAFLPQGNWQNHWGQNDKKRVALLSGHTKGQDQECPALDAGHVRVG